MLFFSRTTRWVLAPLADRLEQPDQASTPLSSNHPLLRRILAGDVLEFKRQPPLVDEFEPAFAPAQRFDFHGFKLPFRCRHPPAPEPQ